MKFISGGFTVWQFSVASALQSTVVSLKAAIVVKLSYVLFLFVTLSVFYNLYDKILLLLIISRMRIQGIPGRLVQAAWNRG